MSKCPRCDFEVAEPVDVCPKCQLDLKDATKEFDKGPFVALLTAETENEAEMVLGLLLDAGIPTWVHTHGTSGVYPFTVGEQSLTEVMVPADKLDIANAVLASESQVSDEELEQDALTSGENLPEEIKDRI